MVGYLSTQVREAQDRVRTALKNSGIYLQPKKITVNLSPADLHKSGTGFDLPIAVAIAASYGMVPKESLENTIIVGELSLNGRLNAVSGILPIAADAGKFHCSRMIVPCQNQREAKAIQGLEVIGAGTLKDVLEVSNKLNIKFDKFTKEELLTGMNIELEHGTINPETNVTNDNLILTTKIALAHLNEFPNYYNSRYGLTMFEKFLKEKMNEK